MCCYPNRRSSNGNGKIVDCKCEAVRFWKGKIKYSSLGSIGWFFCVCMHLWVSVDFWWLLHRLGLAVFWTQFWKCLLSVLPLIQGYLVAFVLKVGLEFIDSQFLAWYLNHCTNLARPNPQVQFRWGLLFLQAAKLLRLWVNLTVGNFRGEKMNLQGCDYSLW